MTSGASVAGLKSQEAGIMSEKIDSIKLMKMSNILLILLILVISACRHKTPGPYDGEGMAPDEKELVKEVTDNPDDYEAHYRLGCFYMDNGRPTDAIEEFNAALFLNPNSFKSWFRLGYAKMLQSRFYDAVMPLENAVALSPDSTIARNNLGYVYIQIGEFGKAEDQFNAVLSIEPDSPEAHRNLAVIYTHFNKNLEKALHHNREFVKLAPDDPRTPRLKQWILSKEKLVEEPPEPYSGEPSEAAEQQMALASKHYADGLDALKAGRDRDAYRYFMMALAENPWHEEANYKMAEFYASKNPPAPAAALQCIRRALTMAPDSERYKELEEKILELVEEKAAKSKSN